MPHREASLTKTDWSMIRDAGSDGREAAEALEHLARRYWPPVYAYIRGTGCDVHQAADLTQGFVCDVIMSRRLFNAADPARGRFRSLLLAAVKNYLRQEHRAASRQKRGSEIAIDPAQIETVVPVTWDSPDAAFCTQWSATLVARVLEQVRESCLSAGLEPHWIIFEQRVARPLLMNEQPAEYDQLVNRLGLSDASQAANMMVTVKRRFARTLVAEVRRTVEDPAEAEAELRELLCWIPDASPRERGCALPSADAEAST